MCCLLVLKFGFDKIITFFGVKVVIEGTGVRVLSLSQKKVVIEGTITSITKTIVQLLNFSSKHFNYKI